MTIKEYKAALFEELDYQDHDIATTLDTKEEKSERRGFIEGLEYAIKLLQDVKESN
jgi:hypothetical protein